MGTLYSVHQMLILSPSEQWVSWGEGGSLLCSLKDSPSFSRVGCDWQFIWSRLRGFAVWIITNCGKFLKKWECQTTLPASWGICMQVKKQQLEVDMEKHWFQIGKGVHQGCILSTCLFNSWETLGWMKQKLESRLLGEISIISNIQGDPTSPS